MDKFRKYDFISPTCVILKHRIVFICQLLDFNILVAKKNHKYSRSSALCKLKFPNLSIGVAVETMNQVSTAQGRKACISVDRHRNDIVWHADNELVECTPCGVAQPINLKNLSDESRMRP